ncbi:DUF3488 domain-containing transglutaminase family protein [Chitinibacter bivalviorum]|uniref:DUF3488 domain-containing transglutaminase family protein n=1 Tax=Chitinibacter bivalviorum TaxID=2739434 RepID=A0A7H9BHI2_9NEIS|nr:DUF3488 and transglutaminase-like domain-containing protein [Chitinibacter bivalviorum]QLG87411.1 DUF3488 domain-containing transglutaminase family protein [Chitinibacter bivalviorum]
MKKAHSRSRILHPKEQQKLAITLAAISLPHLLEQVWWLGLSLALILLLLGSLSADTRTRMPRYLGIFLGVIVGGLVYLAHQTLVGREGGVAVLLGLTIVKLIETRTLRDARALILLMFLLTGVAFLHGQEPWHAAYALLSTFAIIYTAQKIEQEILPNSTNTKTTARLVFEGIPIALLLFLLFPRLPGPLWAVPDSNTGSSGLSGEEMRPGTISKMIQDDSPAFRVTFQGQPPLPAQMYWRGPVFEEFDGLRWRSAQTQQDFLAARQFSKVPRIVGLSPAINYTMTLEPHNQNWLLALDMPALTPIDSSMSNRLQVINNIPVVERKRFDFSAYLTWRTEGDSATQIERNLNLPDEINPQSRALAESWRNLAPEQRVATGLHWLEQNHFSYTLSPPLLTSQNRIDEFLFKNKQGFCEHYASAFAFLMRAAGVPARVITGYQGASQNANYWIVRQADAHAWVEVWYENQGWQRVDPTFVIAPTRINEGLASSINSAQLPFMMRNDSAWLRALRLKLDIMVNGWNQWVVGYDQQKQIDLLKKLGIDDFASSAFLLWLIAGFVTTLGGFAAWLLYKNRAPAPDPASRLYRRFIHKLSPLQKAPSQTPASFAELASLTFPRNTEAINTITALYLRARYAEDQAALQALRKEVATFQCDKTK